MTQLIGQLLQHQAKISEINIKRRLFERKKVATGKLRSQLKYGTMRLPNDGWRMYGMQGTSGYPYWQVIDRGARGPFRKVMPETPDFIAWMALRGIPKEASWPIRKKISRDGIKPSFIFSDENKRTWEDVRGKIPGIWQQALRNKFQEFKNI